MKRITPVAVIVLGAFALLWMRHVSTAPCQSRPMFYLAGTAADCGVVR